MGLQVWRPRCPAAGAGLQADPPAAELPGAVGCVAGWCCLPGLKALPAQPRFPEGCQALPAQMVLLQVGWKTFGHFHVPSALLSLLMLWVLATSFCSTVNEHILKVKVTAAILLGQTYWHFCITFNVAQVWVKWRQINVEAAEAQGKTERERNAGLVLPSEITVINVFSRSSSRMHKENKISLINYTAPKSQRSKIRKKSTKMREILLEIGKIICQQNKKLSLAKIFLKQVKISCLKEPTSILKPVQQH